ncbi:hypothetical protein PVAND_013223 [Polypedilum vanderplanki]|uniref:Histone deacetylase n=1 Tax=Polypedilum vanderplanki TaxID=319348 RepID=A0A9J6CPT0_POLVA|nr:hypothetical protein PVAND_013223 [Polypedilum vanderplanki]
MAFGDPYKRKICYYYDQDIGDCHFGNKHPMKPHRLIITHELIVKYGLFQKMDVFKPYLATAEDMQEFHSEDYVSFLQSLNATRISNDMKNLMSRFQIGTKENDCPVFDGVFKFAQISAGGSLAAAAHINDNTADIAINWAGGLHHAKKSQASGFCYINDIVLCILELLKYHPRVLYVDIDVHHADGVEEAFYTSNRVMTVSFHRYGENFFPGTGNFTECGEAEGRGYSVNVPLKSGIIDEDYEAVFASVMSKVLQVFSPSVVVMQCGSDSIAGDQLGDFNLTLNAHGRCIKFMRKKNIPLILLGGGGYTIENVSRCWCFDTSIALNETIPNDLPENNYSKYFAPLNKLHIEPDPTLPNRNGQQYLSKLIVQIVQNLKNIEPVPSVQFQNMMEPIVIEDSPKRTKSTMSYNNEVIEISDDED